MSTQSPIQIGWREWLALPELGIPAIKAKVDTGAKTSALHAFLVEPFERGGRLQVRFGIHPLQRRKDVEVFCESEVVETRMVSDSGGHRENRYVIRTPVGLGPVSWPIEITLTNREEMVFRMLLGRSAMGAQVSIHPRVSYCTGRMKPSMLRQLYPQAQKIKKD
jgi:Uncharacterized protein conserved in archaea